MASAILRAYTVYGLRDSRDGVIRYVGQTTSPVNRRLSSHLCEANRGSKPKDEWIKSVRLSGAQVEIVALVDRAEKDIDEVAQIAIYSSQGVELFNITGGGAGLSHCNDATRDQLSASTVARFSNPSERGKTSSATREAMQRGEVKEKLSVAAVARWGDKGNRSEQSLKVTDRFSRPEERAAQSDRTSKLTNQQVIEARRMRRSGTSLKDLCQMFGLAKASMSALCNGKTFKHLPM
jgi:hypothetical protein